MEKYLEPLEKVTDELIELSDAEVAVVAGGCPNSSFNNFGNVTNSSSTTAAAIEINFPCLIAVTQCSPA